MHSDIKNVAKDCTVWCDRGFLPVYYGFCPNEKAWRKSLKHMKVPYAEAPYPHNKDACVSTFDRPGARAGLKSKLCIIMTLNDALDKHDDPTGICALFVHEAMHVWRKIREEIGERDPSAEFEAYAMQFIFTQLMEAYQASRKYEPKKKRKVKK